jgi:hypothetical protein
VTPVESTYNVTSAVASCAAPVSGEVRAWVRPLRRTLAPIFATAKGTSLPIYTVPAGPAVTDASNVHMRGRTAVSYLPTVEKQQSITGVGTGAIPVRTWSPPV